MGGPGALGLKPNDREVTEMTKQYDVTGNIIAYEQGELEQEAVVELFQHLVDSGMAWQLQGSYGRMAKSLIEAGYVEVKT